MLFETVVGHSFKCVSEQSIQLSAQLQMKTMNIHLQAFDFEGDGFGNGKLTIGKSQAAFRNPGPVPRCVYSEAAEGREHMIYYTRITLWSSKNCVST